MITPAALPIWGTKHHFLRALGCSKAESGQKQAGIHRPRHFHPFGVAAIRPAVR